MPGTQGPDGPTNAANPSGDSQPKLTGNEPSYTPEYLDSHAGLPDLNLHTTNPEKEWVPEDALVNLVDERSVRPHETNKETSRRVLNENLPLITQSMIHLAMHSKSERTRLDAGKYIMDRCLGKVGDDVAQNSPIETFFEDIKQFVNEHSSTTAEGEGVL